MGKRKWAEPGRAEDKKASGKRFYRKATEHLRPEKTAAASVSGLRCRWNALLKTAESHLSPH